MKWLKGKNSRGENYCINTESIRNVTKDKRGAYLVWFTGVSAYQEITKDDYDRLMSYFENSNYLV